MTEQEALNSLVEEFNKEEVQDGFDAEQANSEYRVGENGEQDSDIELSEEEALILKEFIDKEEALRAHIAYLEELLVNNQNGNQMLAQGGVDVNGMPNNQEDMSGEAKNEQAIAQLQQELQAQQEYIEEQNAFVEFQKIWEDFSKTHPNVEQDELAKWAIENDLEPLLANKEGWDTIYRALRLQASSKETPDFITPTSKSSGDINAFDRRKKGEDVSDIELGLELLKTLG